MQVDGNLAADPVDVVTAFHAQQPGHRGQHAAIDELAVVLVGADVAILTERERMLHEVKKIVPDPFVPR